MTQGTPPNYVGRNEASFHTFIFTIARNTLNDFWRCQCRKRKLEQAYGAAQPPLVAAPNDHEIEIQQLLSGLTPQEQCVVHLLRQGYTQTEIATILGISNANVTRLKHKIITRGRAIFGQQELDGPVPHAHGSALKGQKP